jgi:dihydrolipoamide dehydrogenase
LEVDAALVATGRVPNTKNMGLEEMGIETQRGFVAVNKKMQVLTKHGEGGQVIPHVYCIGDTNGKMMLALAASAQGISAVENICGREHAVNHNACFTHPEIAMMGPTKEQCRERAEKEGWTVGKSQGSFRANSKALVEGEGQGFPRSCLIKIQGRVVQPVVGMHKLFPGINLTFILQAIFML